MPSNEQCVRLFVYGTLRNDPTNEMFAVLAQFSTCLGQGRTRGKLYDLGSYPGMILSDQGDDFVIGEVYSLHPSHLAQTWRLLDEYEGCSATDPEPHEYSRRLIRVVLIDGQELQAWAYVLNALAENAVHVPGGDYLTWRRTRRTA